MNRRIARFVLASMVGLMAATAWAVQPGNPAPDFTAQDTHGQTHTLAQYKGKYVVLEWHNRECPFTHKTLREREHAAPPAGVDRQGRGLVHGDFLRAGATRLHDRRPGKRLPRRR